MVLIPENQDADLNEENIICEEDGVPFIKKDNIRELPELNQDFKKLVDSILD